MRVLVFPPLYVFKTSDLKPVFRMLSPSTMTIKDAKYDASAS